MVLSEQLSQSQPQLGLELLVKVVQLSATSMVLFLCHYFAAQQPRPCLPPRLSFLFNSISFRRISRTVWGYPLAGVLTQLEVSARRSLAQSQWQGITHRKLWAFLMVFQHSTSGPTCTCCWNHTAQLTQLTRIVFRGFLIACSSRSGKPVGFELGPIDFA